MKYKVLDTNIILDDASNIKTLAKDRSVIVLPETVLAELDNKKTGLGEIAYQAREFGRMMTNAKIISTGISVDTNLTVVTMELDEGTRIETVSIGKYPESADTNDKKIIAAASMFKEVAEAYISDVELKFITNDVMCKIIAISQGLDTTSLQSVDTVGYEFTKKIQVPTGVFIDMHRKSIYEVDKDYTLDNYNYIVEDINTGQIKLVTISNYIVYVLGKETEQELRKQEINPIGVGQLFLSKAIMDPVVDLVVVEARAGSGKTLLSLSNAIRLIRTNSPYSSIIYIRTSVSDVESQEEIGFLKGDLDEKTRIYFHPLMDSLDVLAKNRLGNTRLKGEELDDKLDEIKDKIIAECGITAMTSLGLRGRTIEDSVVIIDEAQNISKAQMQKILTRVGKNCKVIVLGSNKQIDHPYLTKYTNGLSVLLDDSVSESSIRKHMVPLDKVVRSEFAAYAENLFEDAK